LNSRVVSNNSAPKSKDKGKAKQETLDRVPLEIQEAMILEDLLYVLLVSDFIAWSSIDFLMVSHQGH
jgi:hypothetical protein